MTKNLKSIQTEPGSYPAPKGLRSKVPSQALAALSLLSRNGFTALLAGGCVRDLLLGRKPKDWDIVTDAPLTRLRALFPDHLEVGAAFGILKLPPRGGVHIDVGIFRRESGYSDARHPDVVEVGDSKSDQARRDFTVNALYLDADRMMIIDGVGGKADLKAGLLRTVGKPADRFTEDALRILRAARFAAQLGFDIEPGTLKAMKKSRTGLARISRERVREETMRALATAGAPRFLRTLHSQNLWPAVFGKPARSAAPARVVKWAAQKKLAGAHPALHWLAALTVMGAAKDLTELLRLSNEEKHALTLTAELFEASRKAKKTLARAPQDFIALEMKNPGLLAFAAKAAGSRAFDRLCTVLARWSRAKSPHWVTANALMNEGYEPGPKLGKEIRRRNWEALFASRN